MKLELLSLLYLLGIAFGLRSGQSMPLPFTRVISLTSPYMTGNDVIIAQSLLNRDSSVDGALDADGVFGKASQSATISFQQAHHIAVTGEIDANTATSLLEFCGDDGYVDSGVSAGELGYLYKIHIQVHANRSIENKASLLDKDNNLIFSFTTRTHGHHDDGSADPWPDYSNDFGLNEFTSGGNTPTGFATIDLNSPEPDPDVYGPWPVNRIVKGLEGNAAFLLPSIRDGLLIHTGNWPGWETEEDMPNSSGCIHTHPEDCDRLWQELSKLGVVIRPNTYSGKNYPYEEQGIFSMELID